MQLEVVTIGTELLLGFTVDTNGAEIAQQLAADGVRVVRRTAVPDDAAAIREAVSEGLRRAGAVLTTGGLGPTSDDITRPVLAGIFEAPLEFDPAVWADLAERYRRLGRTPPDSNRVQAEVPSGATVLPNRWGTAPGLWLEGPPGLVVALPGVPHEMRNLLLHEVRPRLAARAGPARPIRSLQLRTTGLSEAAVYQRIRPLEAALTPLSLAYLPGVLGVDLRITAWGLPAADADRRLTEAAERLREAVGEHCYGDGDADLAARVLELARTRRRTLAVAESCTGGLVGGRLTAVAGASDVFLGGVIAYDNRVKVAELEVPEGLLREHGAVSGPVAEAMARGACRRLQADVAVAVTGVAGPGGGSAEKPVGTVWLAVAAGDRTESVRTRLPGDRDQIRARAAQAALFLLRRRLLAIPGPPVSA